MTTQIEDRIAQLEKENARLDAAIRADAAPVPRRSPAMEGVPTAKPTFGYYRQPDGWITVSPATDTDELKYRRLGWTPLKQYGYVEMATAYAASHPLEGLFMRGGAIELCEDQIRRGGFYMDPPLVPSCRTPLDQNHRRHTEGCLNNARPVVFPQLEGKTDLGPFPCTICERVLPTVEARNQHTTVMHAPEKSDERTGDSLAAALIKGLGGRDSSGIPDTAVAAILAKMAAMEAELAALKAAPPAAQLFHATCSVCNKEFSNVNQRYADRALQGHQRQVHARAAAAV